MPQTFVTSSSKEVNSYHAPGLDNVHERISQIRSNHLTRYSTEQTSNLRIKQQFRLNDLAIRIFLFIYLSDGGSISGSQLVAEDVILTSRSLGDSTS
jgi:hypothetical protein